MFDDFTDKNMSISFFGKSVTNLMICRQADDLMKCWAFCW
jgi:hypothetical protein